MNPLKSRKQLLLVESELNRNLLIEEMTALKADLRTLADRAKSYGTIASSIAALVAGLAALAALRRRTSAEGGAKSSWLQLILKGAGVLSTFWRAFRHRGDEPKSEP